MSEARPVDPSVSRNPIALDAKDLPTVCVLCSHNCGIRVDVEDGHIVDVRADETNPITHGYICNKGVTVSHYAHHKQRTEYPLRRREDGTFERIDWDTAIREISEKLGGIRDEHGARAIGLVGIGGQANHMDAPYGTSFLRGIGSRRLFNAYAQEKTQHHLVDGWMFDCAPSLFFHPDFENSRYLIVMGTNPKISNRGHAPNELFKQLAKDPDKTVVVLDPRETETTRTADRHLKVRPGHDAYFLLGMAAAMVQNELYDYGFVEQKTVGFEQIRDVLASVDVAEMAQRCGLSTDEIVSVTRDFTSSGAGSIMYDLGVEQTPFSTLVSYLIRLNLTLGGYAGRRGGEVFMETFAPPKVSEGRHAEPERALASGIQGIRALGNFAMFSPTLVPEEILIDHPERMRAVIVEGSNPLLSYSDSKAWREAIDALDLLVVIDPAFSETARLADYVLPTPCGYEKWEIALFPKRHPEIDVHLRPPVIPGPAEALPEAEIYVRLAEAMGIVEPVPAELVALADTPTAEARTEFMMTAMGLVGEAAARGIDAETQMLFWAYRVIGAHFDAPSLAAIWLQCQMNAVDRHADVLRTLGEEWAERTPLEIGEETFRRILAHPEGVEIARLAEDKSLDDYIGFDDKRVRVAPDAMLAEIQRALETKLDTDQEFPFVLGSGLRTRWTANTIQRDPGWRKGAAPHCTLRLAPDDAASLDVAKGDTVRVSTRRGAIELPAEIDKKLMRGHCSMPNGFGMQISDGVDGAISVDGANCNEITDTADRDPLTGCPHHRYVRVKLEKISAVGAAA